MQRVLVTGATGFIGRALVEALLRNGFLVRCAVRGEPIGLEARTEIVQVDDIGPRTDWSAALGGVKLVIHAAGLAHLSDATSMAIEATFMRTNADGTGSLAAAAADSGVARLLLLSSIGVNGRASVRGPFREDDKPNPEGPYARSKLMAEDRLREIATEGSLQWCILRPPMVYGAGAPGNFARLASLVTKGWPLPLGCASAKRSFISLHNMVSATLCAISHPAAANSVFLVSDGEDVSSADFVRALGAALGRPARLVPVPETMMRTLGAVMGKSSDVSRLFDPLQMDCSRIQTQLGWAPPLTLAQGMQRAVQSAML